METIVYQDIYNALDQILQLISSGETADDESVTRIYHECVKLTNDAIGAETDPFFSNILMIIVNGMCALESSLIQALLNCKQHSLQQVLGILCWHMQVISERKGMVGNFSQEDVQMQRIDDPNAPDISDITDNGTVSAVTGVTQNEFSERYDLCEVEVEDKNDLLQTMLKKPNFNNGLEDVAGLFEAKHLLNQAIILPSKYPQLFQGARRPWKRILLYGPPGTGKTRLAHAVAAQSGIRFYCVSSADLLSSWVGESEKLVRTVFQTVRQLPGPSIIFIDEIDGLCRKRSTQEEDHSRRMKTELLNQIEGSKQDDENDNVILLGATNCPWDLDTAFMRRFQRRIYIPLPDREARKKIIKMHSMDDKENNCDIFSESDWNELLNATVGYSGSDLANLSTSALLEPIRDLEEATSWAASAGGQMIPCNESHPLAISCKLQDLEAEKVATRKVTLSDFLKGVTVTPRTNSDEDIKKFTEFIQKFGSSG